MKIKALIVTVFLVPGIYLFAQNNDPGRWEETIVKFEMQDQIHPPAKGAVLFTGSSSIAMWQDIEETFPEYEIINRGFGGSEFSDLIYYADRIIYPYEPSQIFIYEGDNDLAAGESIDSILKEAQELREEIRRKLPNVPVIFISPKPSISRWELKEDYEKLNKALEDFAANSELTGFADVWSAMLDEKGEVRKDVFLEDDLHMNSKGYKIWKTVLMPFMEERGTK